MPMERLLHEGDLLRCFRNSVSVTYVSTPPLTSSSAPCNSSFAQSLSTLETNVREWHFVQHSYGASTLRVPHGSFNSGIAPRRIYRPGGGDAFELYRGDLRCETPLLMHTPADPAGAKPRRDHRSLARMSRGEAPKTPGYRRYALYIRPRQGVALHGQA